MSCETSQQLHSGAITIRLLSVPVALPLAVFPALPPLPVRLIVRVVASAPLLVSPPLAVIVVIVTAAVPISPPAVAIAVSVATVFVVPA